MRSQNVPRDYKMNDSEMCFLASKICSYLTRDLAKLQDFGIDQHELLFRLTIISLR